MSNNINENLIDQDKSDIIELSDSYTIKVKDEDENEKLNDKIEEAPKAQGNHEDDKSILESMGFQRALIDKIYSSMHPNTIEDALDYLNKNDNDKFTHSYIPNNLNLCTICGCGRSSHANSEIIEPLINNNININNNSNNNNSNSTNYDDFDPDILRMIEKYRGKFDNSYSGTSHFAYYEKKECKVCSDEIDYKDLEKVKIPCKHFFCIDCWKEYLKEKINNANVYKLSCMEHKCGYVLEEKFIKSILENDAELLEKYNKFLTQKKIIFSNKNMKFCPIPDCDGYAIKKFSKKVKCNYGHEFCYECLAAPHGLKPCSKIIDAGFEEWKSHKMVKRCPNCKFYTEKNEGCNHMTCSQCKFQWCWVCEKECIAGHYDFGRCKGLHFSAVKNDEDAKRLMRGNCDCCCILGWLITNFIYLVIYLFMMPCFYLAVIGFQNFSENQNWPAIIFYSMSFLPFFICYEVWSICYITVFSIPGLFICPYNRFLKGILFGKILGELFPV